MSDFYVSVGDCVRVAKTNSESDVYLFAGITGDFSPNHVNAEFMASSAYGQRLVHGAFIVGLMSTASTAMVEGKKGDAVQAEKSVALGYDRIRFLAPVFFGDTVTVSYTISEVDTEKRRSRADIAATNQHGQMVCAAVGLLKWVPVDAGSSKPQA